MPICGQKQKIMIFRKFRFVFFDFFDIFLKFLKVQNQVFVFLAPSYGTNLLQWIKVTTNNAIPRGTRPPSAPLPHKAAKICCLSGTLFSKFDFFYFLTTLVLPQPTTRVVTMNSIDQRSIYFYVFKYDWEVMWINAWAQLQYSTHVNNNKLGST